MSKKPRFSYKLSNRPGRFKIFERQGGEKLHIANVIVKNGLTETQAIRLIDLLNAKGEAIESRAANVMGMAQMFEQRVKQAAQELLNDNPHDNTEFNDEYDRAIFELAARLTDRWDLWIGTDSDKQAVINWARGIEEKPKFPHPVLAEVSELLLRAEDRLNDLREYDLTEDEFGVLDIETDVQSLVAKVQGIIDAEEASVEEANDPDPTHEKLLQEVLNRDEENDDE